MTMASPPPAPHMRDPSPSRSDPTRGAPASGPGSSPGTSEAADEVTPLIQHPHLHSDDNPALHHHHQHQHLHPWSAAWGFAGPTTAAAAAAAAEAEAVGGNSRSSSSMSRGGATRRRRRSSNNNSNYDVESVVSSRLSADELALGDSAIGERLPYAAYTTIDWLHDLVSRGDVASYFPLCIPIG
ncbi:putative chloride channel [Zalerion maritima]|uniref:Chloride channel n=1 Tax=Zalerion maritima TaxID=339359 RepID=A0AAD5RV72_9PEZI|nr:putative chloride channel [Zalerion maritima]